MEELELDERKTKILNAIIRNYLETAIMDVYPYTADKDANPEFSDEKKKQE